MCVCVCVCVCVCGAMVIVGNEHGDTSPNLGRD